MEGRVQELLEGVEEFEIEYLDSSGEWQLIWPPLASNPAGVDVLPVAVRYRLETSSFGEIVRLVEITQ
jgi:type II secretion system protein J